MIFPVPTGTGDQAERRPSRLVDIYDEVKEARPELPEDSEAFRAAVLLLLVGEMGLNVDKLVLRTRYPREYVSRCMRRAADNALWLDGVLTCTWSTDRARSEEFWWDVEVALGRQLRRIDGAGRVEWAPLDGWFKDFDYTGRRGDEKAVYNEYHFIAARDPEPASAQGIGEEGIPDGSSGGEEPTKRMATESTGEEQADESAAAEEWPSESEWMSPSETDGAAPADTPLADGWSHADWLV